MEMFLKELKWSFLIITLYFAFSFKSIDGNVCGRTNHNNSVGELVPHEQLKPGQNCSWHVFPETHKMIESFLVFEEFELESNDKCIVNKHNGPQVFPPFSGKKGMFTVLPGYLYLDVSLNIQETPSTYRKFRMHFSANECDYMIDKYIGHIASPLYEDMQRSNDVICTFKFRDYKKLDLAYLIIFREFHLTNSTLIIKDHKSQDRIYTGTDIPSNIVVPEGTIFELHLNTKIPGEKYSFDFNFGGHDPSQKSTTTDHDGGVTTVTPTPFNDIAAICGRSEYIEENGTITLGNTERTNITFTCSWNMNCEQIPNAKEIYISIEQFTLGNDDSFKILDSNEEILFGPYNGKKDKFSILTGNLKLQIQVEISKNEKIDRKLKITFDSKKCNNELTNESGIVKLPLYKPSQISKMVTCTWTFDLSDKNSIEKVSFVKHKFNGQLSFQGNVKPTDILGTDVHYILVGESGMIKLNFDTHTETEFIFVYERVAEDCSSYIQLTEDQMISSTLQENTFNFWTSCFWIIQCPENHVVSVDIEKLNLVNVEDFISITDGNYGNSPVLAQFNSGNQNKVNEKIIISRNNSISIFFNRPFEKRSEFKAKLSISSCDTYCDNGFCKLDEWNCNGIDECGDESDELNCNGTYIRPTKKTPNANTKNKSTGISPLALGLAVPAAIISGIIMTIGFAALRQIYRDRSQSNYGHFPIYNDA